MLGCLCVLQMGIKELSELQSELDSLKEENEQMEDKLLMQHDLSREKVCLQVRTNSDTYHWKTLSCTIIS